MNLLKCGIWCQSQEKIASYATNTGSVNAPPKKYKIFLSEQLGMGSDIYKP